MLQSGCRFISVKTQPHFLTSNEERQGELGEHEADGAEEGEAQAAAEDQRRADYGRRDLAHRELLGRKQHNGW